PKHRDPVLFYFEYRDRRIRTNDGINARIENLRQILRFLCGIFLVHERKRENQKDSERRRARPQQTRNRPPPGGCHPRWMAIFLCNSFAELMTEELFVR